MSEPPVPEARIVKPPFRSRFAVSAKKTLRFIAPALPGVGVVGMCAVMIAVTYSYCQAESLKKTEACLTQRGSLQNVERLVRGSEGLRAYAQDPPGSKILKEYAFPVNHLSTIEFRMDVPPGEPIRIEWRSWQNSSEWCLTHNVVHIRAPRDIE